MLVRDLPQDFLPGSLVWRDDVNVGLVDHYGVAVQTFPVPAVAHIDKSDTGKLNVKVETLDEFAQGRQVKYERVVAPVPLGEMWNRVQAVVLAKKPFGLLAFGEAWNCESFARYVKSGLPVSQQAEGLKKAVAAGAVVGVILVLGSSD